jgi:hypothetical protein
VDPRCSRDAIIAITRVGRQGRYVPNTAKDFISAAMLDGSARKLPNTPA